MVANAEYARINWLRQFEKENNFTANIERKLTVNDIDLIYGLAWLVWGLLPYRPTWQSVISAMVN